MVRALPLSTICALITTAWLPAAAFAGPVSWVDWSSSDAVSVYGTALVDGSTIAVTYTGERGFIQTTCGTDYWTSGAVNPYTSATVDNPPNADPDPALRCDIIALNLATPKLLEFSEPVTNPLFAVVSLNGNGYRFDRDFDILSFAPGYWGAGTLAKQVTTNADGSITYDLIGTGEPHGVIQFIGTFQTVAWSSLTNEFWNGFSIAVEHLAVNVPPEIEVSARGAPITDGQLAPLDFGTWATGTSTTVELTIANTGTGPLNISSFTITGAGQFSAGPVVPAIAAGASTIVALTYTASIAAIDNASITIANDDSDEAQFTFPIVGRAAIDGGEPDAGLEPDGGFEPDGAAPGDAEPIDAEPLDGSVNLDAAPTDGSEPSDAAAIDAEPDGGAPGDSGALSDVGGPTDSGATGDSGAASDTGVATTDGGAPIMEESDQGCGCSTGYGARPKTFGWAWLLFAAITCRRRR